MSSKNDSVALAAMFALVLLSGCAATRTQESAGEVIDDATIATRVRADLIASPVTKKRQIEVEVRRGEVQLSGFVDNEASRVEAARLASSEHGVTSVHNRLIVRAADSTIGDKVDDSVITVKVKAALIADPDTKAREIHVETSQGVVELAGFVNTEMERSKAGSLAADIAGVTKVVNHIEIKAQ